MILDAQNLFSQNQAVSATANATTDLDLGPIASANGQRDLGAAAEKLFFVALSTAAGTGTGTVQVTLETDTTSAFSSPTTLYTGPAFTGSALTAGQVLASIPMPSTVKKYLRVVYTVVGTATASVSAFLTDVPQDNVSYAAGYSFPTGA